MHYPRSAHRVVEAAPPEHAKDEGAGNGPPSRETRASCVNTDGHITCGCLIDVDVTLGATPGVARATRGARASWQIHGRCRGLARPATGWGSSWRYLGGLGLRNDAAAARSAVGSTARLPPLRRCIRAGLHPYYRCDRNWMIHARALLGYMGHIDPPYTGWVAVRQLSSFKVLPFLPPPPSTLQRPVG